MLEVSSISEVETRNSKLARLFYVVFFLSGATGLVYEVIWVRLTGLVFGNTSHAISTVLGAFMAGLALGSWKLGQYADRVKNPLRAYGLLEIGIGISSSLVPMAFRFLNSFHWAIAPSISVIPGGDSFVRFTTSFAILLIPTFMMGGTLPMLSRFFTQSVEEVERKVGLLYALNTFGAAVGTLAAALVFIPGLGNLRTTFLIAATNLLIGLFAIWLDSQRGATVVQVDDTSTVEERSSEAAGPTTARLVLIALAMSGFVAMIYEVAWTRALAAMLGSSTYAFSIMLVTFLVGIALGSSYVSRKRPVASIRSLGLVQLGIAAGGFVFLVGYIFAPYMLVAIIRALFYSFPTILTTQFIMCAMLMIIATLCMGAMFPIGSQLYSREVTILGRSVGNIYSVNTIGSIAGSLLAGFFLLPVIGTERTILVGLFFNSAMALVLLSEPSDAKYRSYPRWVALGLLLIATLSMRGGVFWHPDMLDRGILIYSSQFGQRPELSISEHYEDTDVVYFKEGSNASISVRKGENYLGLRTNGKVDASNKDDMMTQLTIAYLAGFFHPSPRNALIIGYGSGVTVGAATTIPELQEIDCVEIEKAVVGAGPWFSEINRKSYENPKVHFTFDDARNYMNVTRKQYDIIISEPSNPWIAGVGSLFTAEFYDRAAAVLKPDGVFAQWVQLYELDPEDLRMILMEFQRKFPEVSAWNTGIGDLILIGARQPQHLDLGRVAQIAYHDPSIMKDIRDYLKMSLPEGILAYYLMSNDDLRKLAETSRRNTDDHPLLEFHAPRQLFAATRDLNIDLLYDAKVGLIPPGVEIPDPEATYRAMIEPLLQIKRSNLANQAMGMLAQTGRKNDATLQIAIARLNLDSGNLDNADAALKKAAGALKSGAPAALQAETEELWGTLEEKLGASEEAIQHYARAADVDPRRSLSLRKLAELNAEDQNWAEAAMWMERYVSLRPLELGHYWAVLGDYRFAATDPDNALEALETALHIDPYTYWGHYRMARLFEDENKQEDAARQYEFIIHYANDRDADIYVKLGNLYKSEGRLKDARRVLAKGRRIFPTNVPIYRLYREVNGD